MPVVKLQLKISLSWPARFGPCVSQLKDLMHTSSNSLFNTLVKKLRTHPELYNLVHSGLIAILACITFRLEVLTRMLTRKLNSKAYIGRTTIRSINGILPHRRPNSEKVKNTSSNRRLALRSFTKNRNSVIHFPYNLLLVSGALKETGMIIPMADLSDLQEGDLKYAIDFKTVYAAILINGYRPMTELYWVKAVII